MVSPENSAESGLDASAGRRRRLRELIALAQTYRGWTKEELAKALGRAPNRLIPDGGWPKLDLVVRLSEVLDWSVESVAHHIDAGANPISAPSIAMSQDFEQLDADARYAHLEGRYRLMVDLAQRAYEVAATEEQRARACNREAGGWDGLGRYTMVQAVLKRGLGLSPVPAEDRDMLQGNLAHTHYALWSLVEAQAVADDLIRRYDEHPPGTMRARKTHAFVRYVAGHARRRRIITEPDRATFHAAEARRDMVQARELYRSLAEETDFDGYAGIANTCEGGVIEVDVTLGNVGPDDALARIWEGLEPVGHSSEELDGDWLESIGWWAIFGCNIALRSLTDESALQRQMAVFTNKADEIAERLGNWSMRERVFTMEHSRWERSVGRAGFDAPRIIDEDEIRIITGTMDRFPAFRETGWRILRAARVVDAAAG